MISVHSGWPKDPPPPFRGEVKFEPPIVFMPAHGCPAQVVGFVAFKLRGLKALAGVPIIHSPGERKSVVLPGYMMAESGDWVALTKDQLDLIGLSILECPVVAQAVLAHKGHA